MTRTLACLAALALGACGIPGEGPTMEPGRNCKECHSWTASGTVFANVGDPTSAGVQGVRVSLTGSDGRTITVKSNQAGNFYTAERLSFPLRVARIEGRGVARVMSHEVPHGGCNLCHTVPGVADAGLPAPDGRIALVGGGSGDEFMNPGQSCLACHDGAAATAFSVAGTIRGVGQGIGVRLLQGGVVVKTLVTNSAGNFFTPEPLPAGRFDIELVQGGTRIGSMSGREADTSAPLGCNGCHEHGGGVRPGGGD